MMVRFTGIYGKHFSLNRRLLKIFRSFFHTRFEWLFTCFGVASKHRSHCMIFRDNTCIFCDQEFETLGYLYDLWTQSTCGDIFFLPLPLEYIYRRKDVSRSVFFLIIKASMNYDKLMNSRKRNILERDEFCHPQWIHCCCRDIFSLCKLHARSVSRRDLYAEVLAAIMRIVRANLDHRH